MKNYKKVENIYMTSSPEKRFIQHITGKFFSGVQKSAQMFQCFLKTKVLKRIISNTQIQLKSLFL